MWCARPEPSALPPFSNPCYLGASAVSMQCTWARIHRGWAQLHQEGQSLYITPPSLPPSPSCPFSFPHPLSSFSVRVFECLVRRLRDLGLSGGFVCVLEQMSLSNNAGVPRCSECWRLSFLFIPRLPPTHGGGQRPELSHPLSP